MICALPMRRLMSRSNCCGVSQRDRAVKIPAACRIRAPGDGDLRSFRSLAETDAYPAFETGAVKRRIVSCNVGGLRHSRAVSSQKDTP